MSTGPASWSRDEPRRALIDRRLHLPERSWCTDPERRQAAGMPGEVWFATKPRLAWEMIAAALDAGVEAPWVTGDAHTGRTWRPGGPATFWPAPAPSGSGSTSAAHRFAQTRSPPACPRLPGADTAPATVRRACASTTGRGSVSAPASTVSC
ncbi:transposase [Streptomyces goshikiensis]|uniref:transposase n=1 Tax=Streptomyces goshikiensis TaxID=1942 RepID=UPI0037B64D5D